MRDVGEVAPGGMAAILGIDISTLEKICTEASNGEDAVQVANDNCPGQVVISGATPALERAMVLAKSAGARRAIRLAVSIAPHSALMGAIKRDFVDYLADVNFIEASRILVGNVSAQSLIHVADIESDLRAQLTSRVRWTESIQYMISQGVNVFLEFGSGNVLTGLLRRIDRGVKGISLSDPKNFAPFF